MVNMSTRPSLIIYLKLFLMATFWGGTFIAGRFLADYASPFSSAFIRFFIASAALLLLTLKTSGQLPPIKRNQFGPLLLLGLSGVFSYNAFFFKGLELIEASRAAVIIANNPIIIALFAALLLDEKLTLSKLAGILLSIFGALVVITHGHPQQIISQGIGKGELYIFGCVVSWVVYSLVGRVAMRGFSPLEAVTYSSLVGTLLLFPVALYEGLLGQLPKYSLPAWACLFYLGLCGTVLAFIWYYQGIQKIGSTRAGQFINFVPVSGVMLSIWLLGEPLTMSLLTGLILVSCGVYLTNRKAA